MQTNIVSVWPDTPVAEALAIMDQNNLRVLPIMGDDRKCRGLASVFKMTMFYLPAPNRLFESRRVVAEALRLLPPDFRMPVVLRDIGYVRDALGDAAPWLSAELLKIVRQDLEDSALLYHGNLLKKLDVVGMDREEIDELFETLGPTLVELRILG